MSLFTVFGRDPDEVQAEIEEKEERIEELEDDLERAQNRARKKNRRKSKHQSRAERKHLAIESVEERLPKVEDRRGAVETLDQPRVAYKSVNSGVATLVIPPGATVVHPNKNGSALKRRTDEVDVLKIEPVSTRISPSIGFTSCGIPSTTDDPLVGGSDTARKGINYEVGETFRPSDSGAGKFDIHSEPRLNEDTSQECAGGIHFFREKADAEQWHRSHN